MLWQRQPNGVQTDYGYDPAGRLVRVEHSDWQDWVAGYEYTLDPAGNRVAVTETTAALLAYHLPSLGQTELSVPSGAGLEPVTSPSALGEGEAIAYSYDAADRLIGASYASGDYYGYAYDAVGNRTVLTTTAGTTGYVYDDADRLVSVEAVACAYDNRGNLLSDGTWSYSYNAAGRLVRAETITAIRVYTYNGDGLLVAQSIDGVETTFTWDQALQIPQVLATSDGTKSLYGLERLGVLEGGTWHYPQHDALGSVRQWTDATAAVLAMQAYSPFGVPRATLAVAPWGFTGEWHDPAGLVYLRARWYNPALGRFTQVDPWPGVLTGPATRHAYAYGLNNPLRYYDPTGLNGESSRDESDEFWVGFARQWLYNNFWFNPLYQQRFAPSTHESSAVRLGRSVANAVSVVQSVWEVGAGVALLSYGGGPTAPALVAALATGGQQVCGGASVGTIARGAVIATGGVIVVVHGVGVGVTALQSAERMLAANAQGGARGGTSGRGSFKPGDKTPGGRAFGEHAAKRANDNGFTAQQIDDAIDNYSQKLYQTGGKTVYAKKTTHGYDVVVVNRDNMLVTVDGGTSGSLPTWRKVLRMLSNQGGYSTVPLD